MLFPSVEIKAFTKKERQAVTIPSKETVNMLAYNLPDIFYAISVFEEFFHNAYGHVSKSINMTSQFSMI